MNLTSETVIVLLAAGSSSRLGQPKQLLSYKGRTLIERLAAAGLGAALGPVFVVTGSGAEVVGQVLEQMPVQLLFNKDWREGMGASISVGMNAVITQVPDCDKVILAVCDQPFVDAGVFRRLEQKRIESGKGIVASAYAGTIGTPVLFESAYFEDLRALSGDKGAKSIVNAHGTDLATIDFGDGAFDIDNVQDYARLLQKTEEV